MRNETDTQLRDAQNARSTVAHSESARSYPAPVVGVYVIADSKTARAYVGMSSNVFSRWAGHLHEALTAPKYELHKQMASRAQDFSFQLLQVCADRAEAEDFELRYIAQLMSDGTKLYNVRGTTASENPYLAGILRSRIKPEVMISENSTVPDKETTIEQVANSLSVTQVAPSTVRRRGGKVRKVRKLDSQQIALARYLRTLGHGYRNVAALVGASVGAIHKHCSGGV